MKGCFWSLLWVCIPLFAGATETVQYALSGTVRDKASGNALEYAALYIEELGIGTTTGGEGIYKIKGIPAGDYHLRVQYLGYASVTVLVHVIQDVVMNVGLDKFSLELEGVNVLGEFRPEDGSAVRVKQEALKYIQPSSLSDVFQLVPGGLLNDGNLSKLNQVTSRQAGSDRNTAFGMAIVVDGAPLSNNATMQDINNSDSKVADRSMLNGGIDLRMISTDHLEEAEVIQGIPSVKYGDLTSGVVLLKTKKGYSPWQIRVKADPLNKLGYIGKGFRLPGKGGTLNVGVDVLQARPDVRERLQQYTRISSSLLYANKTSLMGKGLAYDFSVKYYGTLESEKNDPDLLVAEDTYKSRYNRFTFTTNGGWEVNLPWLNRLDLVLSADYTADILKRRQTVAPTGIVALSLSQEEGESEGLYLPSEYLSVFRNEDRPLGVFAQLTAKSICQTGGLTHSFLYGYEGRWDKNMGEGMLYDPIRPPYPTSSSSSRPRSYRSIPAMLQHAFFAEDNMYYSRNGHKFSLKLGVRLTNMGNLPQDYALRGKVFAEPRMNIAYTFPSVIIAGRENVFTLRGGYGEQVKLPSMDQLYPDKVWFDEVAANYYSQTPENRFVLLMTKSKDRINPGLKVNRNRKVEAGFDWRTGGMTAGVTAFYERSDDGFTYSNIFFSFPYKKYTVTGELPAGKPSLSDFTAEDDVLLKSYKVPVNARKTIKKGIEYQIGLPEITPIRTKITLNGAYYHTTYDVSLSEYYQPSKVVSGKPYPYAGIYKWNSDSRYESRLNTTGRFDTHIPSFRLHFTAFVQVLWFTNAQTKWFSGIPDAYIGPDGITRPFTASEMNDPEFKSLIRTFSANYFLENRKPVSIGLNLKATKEIGNRLNMSFFVNRLWDYNPMYTTNMRQEKREWEVPFFGAELTLKL